MSENAVIDQAVSTDSVLEAVVAPPIVLSDLLVEDVSIDGMCGVY